MACLQSIILFGVTCILFLPRGVVLVNAGDEETITSADIGEYYHHVINAVSHGDLLSPDLGHVDDVRQRVPVLQQRRTDLYTLTATT